MCMWIVPTINSILAVIFCFLNSTNLVRYSGAKRPPRQAQTDTLRGLRMTYVCLSANLARELEPVRMRHFIAVSNLLLADVEFS